MIATISPNIVTSEDEGERETEREPSTTSSTTTLPQGAAEIPRKRILILGAGALGSNIAVNLLADTLPITLEVMDFDKVEERNIQAGTQFYFKEQVGMPKVEALQYNLYKFTGKECRIHDGKFTREDFTWLDRFHLIVDALDNYDGRKAIYDYCGERLLRRRDSMRRIIECLHVGFSQYKTFEVTWNENYQVPSHGRVEFDICGERGARSFINHAAGVASAIIKDFIVNREKKEAIGNAYTSRLII